MQKVDRGCDLAHCKTLQHIQTRRKDSGMQKVDDGCFPPDLAPFRNKCEKQACLEEKRGSEREG